MDAMEALQDTLDSLDELRDVLDPLLSIPMSETMSKLTVLQQAKMQNLLAYVTQDLVFMYLKTKGIPPSSHPVISELARIQAYMKKIKEAESPSRRSLAVDKGAAGRFIAAALAGNHDPANPQGSSTALSTDQERVDVDPASKQTSLPKHHLDDVDAVNPSTSAPITHQTDHQKSMTQRRRPMDPFAGCCQCLRRLRQSSHQSVVFIGYGNDQAQTTDS